MQPKLAELLIHWVAAYAFTVKEHIWFLPFWPALMNCKNHLVSCVNLLSYKITMQTSIAFSSLKAFSIQDVVCPSPKAENVVFSFSPNARDGSDSVLIGSCALEVADKD